MIGLAVALVVALSHGGDDDDGGVGGGSGQVHYCPDSGAFVSQYSGACPSLRVGPYSPGGLEPNREAR
jgi:hypothetical protein